jgi:hypothetical protein
LAAAGQSAAGSRGIIAGRRSSSSRCRPTQSPWHPSSRESIHALDPTRQLPGFARNGKAVNHVPSRFVLPVQLTAMTDLDDVNDARFIVYRIDASVPRS